MKFSDRMIDKLKPGDKRFELLEGDGFTLRVTPAGVKSFYYVFKMAGQNYRLHLGEYPHVSLAAARKRHREALDLRKDGVNPVEAKRVAEEAAAARISVKDLADSYIKHHAKPHKASWEEDQRILDNDVLPVIGRRPADEIRRRDVVALLQAIYDRGAHNASWQTLKVLRKMWNFGIGRDIVEVSPCHMVKPLVKPKAKTRALTADEIRAFWRVLDDDGVNISAEMVGVLRLILVTGQRPGECAGLRWEHIDGDWWTIPAELAKNRREHRVFLTATAQALLGARGEGLVFPGKVKVEGDPPSPFDKAAPARAVRRLVTSPREDETPRLNIPAFTPHDLRRTFATQVGALGYGNEQICRLLNHTDRSVTAIYNRHQYDAEKQEAWGEWEARLLKIIKAR